METHSETDIDTHEVRQDIQVADRPGCRSGLETHLQISNVISDDDLGLNLCIVLIVCYVVVILDDKIVDRANY